METHSPAYDQAARDIFDRLGYQISSADDLHLLAVPVRN